MKRLTFYMLLMVLAITFSCGSKTGSNDGGSDTVVTDVKNSGDSTLYGLACEGCTDSVLVFLSFDGGDPVNFNIIDASKKKKIIGRPETGDWVGVVINKEDRTKADMVIDLDQLKGTWVYMAMPKPRERKVKTMNVYVDEQQRDSVLKSLMVPKEQGFALKRNSVAVPIGFTFPQNDDEDNPVVYPEVKLYTDWSICNGRLVLKGRSSESLKDKSKLKDTIVSDTAEFIFMMKDSLRLKFADGVRSYYRK